MSATVWKRVLERGLEQASFKLNAQQLKVFSHLSRCRTEAAGVETYACSHCGFKLQELRSCRDRHCPCCQYRATQKWCEARRYDVLPVTYYHLVFTLPSALNGWISCHGSVIYRLLFESVWHTLSKFGQDPNRLNGQLGMMGVLHTWGQTLVRHVHLHCLVPGGAITQQGDWHAARSNYLFPVKALSRHYRGRMVSALREAKKLGLLSCISGDVFDNTLNQLMSKNWVVYSKAATYGHTRLIDYLGRYTRRIALTPSRLIGFEDEKVRLRYRDYRDGQSKVMELSATELVRRFALHILPKGFMRVRYYGFLANAVRKKKLEQIRNVLGKSVNPVEPEASETAINSPKCPQCGESLWQYLGVSVRWHWHPG